MPALARSHPPCVLWVWRSRRQPATPVMQALAGELSGGLLQRLLDIFDQIVEMLDADRQAHQIRGAQRPGPFDAGAVLREALDRAQRGGSFEYAQIGGERLRGCLAAGEAQRRHPAEATAHLPRRDGVTGMGGESPVEHVRKLRMGPQPQRNRVRIPAWN